MQQFLDIFWARKPASASESQAFQAVIRQVWPEFVARAKDARAADKVRAKARQAAIEAVDPALWAAAEHLRFAPGTMALAAAGLRTGTSSSNQFRQTYAYCDSDESIRIMDDSSPLARFVVAAYAGETLTLAEVCGAVSELAFRASGAGPYGAEGVAIDKFVAVINNTSASFVLPGKCYGRAQPTRLAWAAVTVAALAAAVYNH